MNIFDPRTPNRIYFESQIAFSSVRAKPTSVRLIGLTLWLPSFLPIFEPTLAKIDLRGVRPTMTIRKFMTIRTFVSITIGIFSGCPKRILEQLIEAFICTQCRNAGARRLTRQYQPESDFCLSSHQSVHQPFRLVHLPS